MNTFDIERLILGAVFIDPTCFWELSLVLEPSAFSDKEHQRIYSAMKEVGEANNQITLQSVAFKTGELKGEPALAFLGATLAAAQGEDHAVPVMEYAHTLNEAYTKRKLREVAQSALEEVSKVETNPFGLIESMMGELSQLARDGNRASEKTFDQVGVEVLQMVNEANQQSGFGLDTGLRSLDDLIGRFYPGDLVLLGGAPGSAKTSLATQISMHISMHNHVGFFELEMQAKALLSRTVAGACSLSVREMMEGVTEGQYTRISDYLNKEKGRRLNLIAQMGISITELCARIRAMKARENTEIVFVDHLGLIRRPKDRSKPHEIAFANAQDLMELGKHLNVTIVCLCHLTKGARQKMDPEPTMEDFYGGGIEQHADLILCNFNRWEWLQKNPPQSNSAAIKGKWDNDCGNSQGRIEIHKLKDRKGPANEMRQLYWDGSRTLFQDIPDEVESQPDLLEIA
ncbi:MAG: DnaB-like helicase C-terminal domain-containing protein [Pseudomonadota bacterium]